MHKFRMNYLWQEEWSAGERGSKSDQWTTKFLEALEYEMINKTWLEYSMDHKVQYILNRCRLSQQLIITQSRVISRINLFEHRKVFERPSVFEFKCIFFFLVHHCISNQLICQPENMLSWRMLILESSGNKMKYVFSIHYFNIMLT